MSNVTLPSVSSQGSLSKYLIEIKNVSYVKARGRIYFSKIMERKKDINSAHKLVTSHLRLSCKNSNAIQRIWFAYTRPYF